MSKFETKVIGHIALLDKINLFCSGDACIIGGSEEALQGYIDKSDPDDADKYKIKKARYGEILAGLLAGAAYAFDEESYQRFQPIAVKEGHDLSNLNFSDEKKQEGDFLIIRFDI